MEAAAASTEIWVLGWSAVLLLAQVVIQSSAASDLGVGYLMSARDEGRVTRSKVAQRLDRALKNLLETYPAFIALALALAVTGKTGGLGATGAMLWLAGRLVYVPVYASGIPVIRTLVWLVSIIGLVLMAVQLLA